MLKYQMVGIELEIMTFSSTKKKSLLCQTVRGITNIDIEMSC